MKKIKVEQTEKLREKLVAFAARYDYSALLFSNWYEDKEGKYEVLAAVGAKRKIETNANSFEALKAFYQERPTWLFGHFSYDVKNQLEKLDSRHPKKFDFSESCFFEPQFLFIQEKNSQFLQVFDNSGGDGFVLENWMEDEIKEQSFTKLPAFQAKESREEYLQSLHKLKAEIQYGNIYEINYCQEFYAKDSSIDPVSTFLRLNEKSPMPFSVFYKNNTDYLLGASPERFIKKTDKQIISQPIKGTCKRGNSKEEDNLLKEELRSDLKEQTENVMIVDLVRNDLSRTAARGSVKVKELFGAYTFPQVHQLISTVESQLSPEHHFVDAIKHAFPMGSMTGAPKVSAMKLADVHEKSRRELYSGTVGYLSPQGDFDFNVVIRSLLYSEKNKYLSLTVGGAITNMSVPEKEYEECLLKAKAIFEL